MFMGIRSADDCLKLEYNLQEWCFLDRFGLDIEKCKIIWLGNGNRISLFVDRKNINLVILFLCIIYDFVFFVI